MNTKKQPKRRRFRGPKKYPKRGYYYHYKHDPNGAFNDYAYYVTGVNCHTEDDCRPIDRFQVGYLPLYEWSPVYAAGKGFFYDSRPLTMFMSKVKKGGKSIPRFTPITDKELIKRLERQRSKMYAKL